jgi:hypothetical protein
MSAVQVVETVNDEEADGEVSVASDARLEVLLDFNLIDVFDGDADADDEEPLFPSDAHSRDDEVQVLVEDDEEANGNDDDNDSESYDDLPELIGRQEVIEDDEVQFLVDEDEEANGDGDDDDLPELIGRQVMLDERIWQHRRYQNRRMRMAGIAGDDDDDERTAFVDQPAVPVEHHHPVAAPQNIGHRNDRGEIERLRHYRYREYYRRRAAARIDYHRGRPFDYGHYDDEEDYLLEEMAGRRAREVERARREEENNDKARLHSLLFQRQQANRSFSYEEKLARVQEALQILARRPLFLSRTVIIAMIENRVANTLATFQELHKINPEKFLKEFLDRDSPIHRVCQFCNDEIIRFFVELCPDSLKVKSLHDYLLPLQVLLETRGPNGLSLETIKILTEGNPEALNPSNGKDPMALAVLHGWPLHVLQYYVDTFPTAKTELLICDEFFSEDNEVLTVDRMKMISKLFPKLSTIALRVARWSREGFLFFLKLLQNNKKISNIQDLSLPMNLLAEDAELRLELRRTIELNTSVRSLNLWACHPFFARNAGRPSAVVYGDSVVTALAHGLRRNQTLTNLQLRGFCLCSIHCLGVLVFGDNPLQTLFLRRIRVFHGSAGMSQIAAGEVSTNNRLKCLTVSKCRMDQGNWQKILIGLSMLPRLEELYLWKDMDRVRNGRCYGLPHPEQSHQQDQPLLMLTSSLVAIVNTAPLLRLLQVQGYDFDPLPFCEALKVNTTLEDFSWHKLSNDMFLDLVKNHNFTLTTLHSGAGVILEPELFYHLDLNRGGLSLARNPSTSLPAFINLLDRVSRGDVELRYVNKSQMLYLLLREHPPLWFTPPASTAGNCHVHESSPSKASSGTPTNVNMSPQRKRKNPTCHV